MYRQGDILLIPDTNNPHFSANYLIIANGVILRGHSTGHTHKIENGQVYKCNFDIDPSYVIAFDDCRLVHQEHATINLPKGTYRIIRQREYIGENEYGYVSD